MYIRIFIKIKQFISSIFKLKKIFPIKEKQRFILNKKQDVYKINIYLLIKNKLTN
jgi:hypothetical protein